MNKGLTSYEKFKVLRPLNDDFKLDKFGIPTMNKVEIASLNFERAKPTNLSNLLNKKDNSDKLVFPFNYDKVINKYWDDPLKYIPLFQTVMGIGTPDYSLYSNMNINEIRHNIYKNRWLGCTWQSYGINAVPTIGWALQDTYDICFSGVTQGSVVMISTIGCQSNVGAFLDGYNEMKKRLCPSLIIVYGDMIPGMTGTFANYAYTDCFNETLKNKEINQIKLFELSPIFELSEVIEYGI